MSAKVFSTIGVIAVATGLGLWLRRALIDSGNEKTAGVTQSNKGGTITTPIQPSNVAVVAPKSTAQLLAEAGGIVRARVPSSTTLVRTSVLQPYGSQAVARAAYTAPIRPEYRPSAYATF